MSHGEIDLMDQKDDPPLCELFDFIGRYNLLRRKFRIDDRDQLMMVQSLRNEDEAVVYGGSYTAVFKRRDIDRMVTKVSERNRAVIAVAPKGSPPQFHTENLIVKQLNKYVFSKNDGTRILIIVSKNSPCGTCQRWRQLQKMCNGYHFEQRGSKRISIPNEEQRFGRCIFLYSRQFEESLEWVDALVQKGWEIGQCALPPTPSPTEFDGPVMPEDLDEDNAQTSKQWKVVKSKRRVDRERKAAKKDKELQQYRARRNRGRRQNTKRAHIEYFDEFDGGIDFNEQLDSSQAISFFSDESLITPIAVLLGVLLMCLLMICSCASGVITGKICSNVIERKESERVTNRV